MKQKTVVVLGDNKIPIDLGCGYFYEFFLEQTDIDLFKESLIDVASINMLKYVKGFVNAGYDAECAMNKAERSIKKEDVDHLINCLDSEELSDLFLTCVSVRAKITVEDLKKKIAEQAEKDLVGMT